MSKNCIAFKRRSARRGNSAIRVFLSRIKSTLSEDRINQDLAWRLLDYSHQLMGYRDHRTHADHHIWSKIFLISMLKSHTFFITWQFAIRHLFIKFDCLCALWVSKNDPTECATKNTGNFVWMVDLHTNKNLHGNDNNFSVVQSCECN